MSILVERARVVGIETVVLTARLGDFYGIALSGATRHIE